MKNVDRYANKWLVLAIDLSMVSFSFVFAYFIRFNTSFDFDLSLLNLQLPLVLVFASLSFLIVGSYKGIIRHTGLRDVLNVFVGVSLLGSLALSSSLISRLSSEFIRFSIPVSVVIIHYLLNLFVLTFSRFIFKAFYEIISTELVEVTHVLIYGAGDSGIITYGALNRDTKRNYEVVGFVDDNKNKIGKKINRIKINGLLDVDEHFITKHKVTEVIISIQQIRPARLLEISDYFAKFDLKVKMVPPLSAWIDGDLNASQIKKINIEDLLNRSPIRIDNPIVQRDFTDQVVMVTGAAGSIGSEISRQLSNYQIKQLILIDQAESPLYELQQELYQKGFLDFVAIVADVRDFHRMETIFKLYTPQKVFHAAAYKHVPLMEGSPYEAVKINVKGTKNIADLSVSHHVDRFVMVSTDKAVNPTNVMGATKRVAEMYVDSLSNSNTTTKFTITRFGNVLGSNGSVIPLFKKQLEQGGPLTVTHKDITRYFMTITEACSLVLEAGTMGKGGEIYVFDMGASVKIFDLAKKMIQLSGYQYPEDIDIQITGLRPGEKLYEELLATGENTKPTYHPKILIANTQCLNHTRNSVIIDQLCDQNQQLDHITTVGLIKTLVPEFKSNNSIYEKLDNAVVN